MTGPLVLPFLQVSTGFDIDSFESLAALSCFKLDFLPVIEDTKTLGCDVGMMDKQVLTAIVGNDKTKSLFLIKPFYNSGSQLFISLGLRTDL